ncbi:MAG: hypothetical protein V7K89_31500 [Nostoc sp.]
MLWLIVLVIDSVGAAQSSHRYKLVKHQYEAGVMLNGARVIEKG